MKEINSKLVICGDGNFMPKLKELIIANKVQDKIELKGMLPPDELWHIAQQAYIGIALAENTGLNQYLALPNKFFDYVHAGLPQLTMNYPEYVQLNREYEVAVLTGDLSPQGIAKTLNNLLADDVLITKLRNNCPPPAVNGAGKTKKRNCWHFINPSSIHEPSFAYCLPRYAMAR